MYEDPEWERYQRKYPRFPGVASCVELLERRNTSGTGVEFVMHQLEEHAAEHLDEIIATIDATQNDRTRTLLVSVLSEADVHGPLVLDLFERMLQSTHEDTWFYATCGLERLDTKASRRALWQARQRR